MGYALAMSGEIRDWMIGLRDDDPAAATGLGQALVALLEEGASLGPPLVASLARRSPADLSQALDLAYQDRLEQMHALRREVADARSQVDGPQLADLESRLLARQLAADAFRTRKEVLKATYTVALAEQAINEADADPASDRDDVAARLRDITREIERELRRDDPAADLLELRPALSGASEIRIVFAVEPAGTALLICVIEGPSAGPAARDQAVAVSAEVLRQVRAGTDPEASACSFVGQQAFLDEFFAGDPAPVIAGAAALAAGYRGGILAAQRIARELSQEQVAERMGVPPARVAEIEQAGPDATEVRVLASYVGALGARLELVADFGVERVILERASASLSTAE